EHTAEVTLNSHRQWAVGQSLALFYDPADPDTVRTSDDPNENQLFLGTCSITLFVALAGVLVSAVAVGRWWRRYRAARRTGWQAATAVVHALRRQRPYLVLRLRESGEWESKLIISTHTVTYSWHGQRHRIWVAGDRRAMTVLFRKRGRLFAVPVKKPE